MGNIKAKDASLAAKIIGTVIIIGGSLLKWTGIFPNCTITEICIVGFSVMGMFGTVDVNIMLEKIFNKTVNTPDPPVRQESPKEQEHVQP